MLYRIILVLLLLATSFNSKAQSDSIPTIYQKDLPVIVEDDTVSFKGAVFVQSEEYEIRQRGRETKLRKKLIKTEALLIEKYNKETLIDKLILERDSLFKENEILLAKLNDLTNEMTEDCRAKIWHNAKRIESLNSTIISLRSQIRGLRRKLLIHKAIILGQAVLITLIII